MIRLVRQVEIIGGAAYVRNGRCPVFIISTQDLKLVQKETPAINSGGYIELRSGRNIIKNLAREIMGNPRGFDVDHINGNKLDNRRENLRIVTTQQNRWNTRGPRGGLVGVRRHGRGYQARISIDGKSVSLGVFDTEEEARASYLTKARELYGDYFPSTIGE